MPGVFHALVNSEYIFNFLLDNSLIYKYQSGFMRGHSTVHQLIEIYHNICLSLENREVMCTVFCDISKAFDKVWHRGLLKKLKAYGISGNLLHWFENYLNCLSEVGNIKSGVPQGSCVRPFAIHIIYQ